MEQSLKEELLYLLDELKEYFDNRADADGDSEGIYPTTEMKLGMQIEEMEEKIKET